MWQDVTSSGCSCKMSIDPLVTLVFYSMIEFQGNPLAIGFFGHSGYFPVRTNRCRFLWLLASGVSGDSRDTGGYLSFCMGPHQPETVFWCCNASKIRSGHLGWSFTVIHNTFWYFLDVWTSLSQGRSQWQRLCSSQIWDCSTLRPVQLLTVHSIFLLIPDHPVPECSWIALMTPGVLLRSRCNYVIS